jgi:hypothetical protein
MRPVERVTVIPVAIRPRSKGERRALAIASDENPDHRRATKIATLAALGCVLLLVLGQLLGCATPAGRLAAGAADITAQTWLAARGVPCLDTPPAPAVEATRPPTVAEVLAVLAWAAEVQARAAAIQRAGSEELAERAARAPVLAAVALPPTHAASTPYREAPPPEPAAAPVSAPSE